VPKATATKSIHFNLFSFHIALTFSDITEPSPSPQRL